MLRLRDRCAAATVETGRQLWPAATLAEYRLALLAPDEWAATVLDGESGRFTIGPLSEVAAVHHTWSGLAPHLDAVPIATFIAHERAIRGETIPPDALASLPPVLDIPAALQPWEPSYPISVYSDAGAEHPEPGTSGTMVDAVPRPGAEVVDDDSTELAVRQLLEAWTAASTGRAETVCVEGDHLDALGSTRGALGSSGRDPCRRGTRPIGMGRCVRGCPRPAPRDRDRPILRVVVARRDRRPARLVAALERRDR